ncbi:hypothetical protein ABZ719_15720 [Streptomyces sp. NPDC006743]|uniref:hypothetical protein n=1 Tax=Streptomyces sp. NPDC006743 TaxID=3154480 RepID=UPI0034515734
MDKNPYGGFVVLTAPARPRAGERRPGRDAGGERHLPAGHGACPALPALPLTVREPGPYRRAGRGRRFACAWPVQLVTRLFGVRSDRFAGTCPSAEVAAVDGIALLGLGRGRKEYDKRLPAREPVVPQG